MWFQKKINKWMHASKTLVCILLFTVYSYKEIWNNSGKCQIILVNVLFLEQMSILRGAKLTQFYSKPEWLKYFTIF